MKEFELFWRAYPKKVGKGSARRAWLKIKDTSGILEGIENSKRFWASEGTDKQYIPMPSTWLNQERWEDEYEVDLRSDKQKMFMEAIARPVKTSADWWLIFDPNDVGHIDYDLKFKTWSSGRYNHPKPESPEKLKDMCSEDLPHNTSS